VFSCDGVSFVALKAREHTNKKPTLLKQKRTKEEEPQCLVMVRAMEESLMEEKETE
jgi:hypothetical protein